MRRAPLRTLPDRFPIWWYSKKVVVDRCPAGRSSPTGAPVCRADATIGRTAAAARVRTGVARAAVAGSASSERRAALYDTRCARRVAARRVPEVVQVAPDPLLPVVLPPPVPPLAAVATLVSPAPGVGFACPALEWPQAELRSPRPIANGDPPSTRRPADRALLSRSMASSFDCCWRITLFSSRVLTRPARGRRLPADTAERILASTAHATHSSAQSALRGDMKLGRRESAVADHLPVPSTAPTTQSWGHKPTRWQSTRISSWRTRRARANGRPAQWTERSSGEPSPPQSLEAESRSTSTSRVIEPAGSNPAPGRRIR